MTAALRAQQPGAADVDTALVAAREETFALHPRVLFGYTGHLASFRSFQGAYDCGEFSSGSGWNPSFMLGIERTTKDNVTLGVSLGLTRRSGLLSVANTGLARNTATGELVEVETSNDLDAAIQQLDIIPEAYWNPSAAGLFGGRLRLGGGIRLSFPLAATFAQKEIIVRPASAVFIADGRRVQTRDIASGTITEMSAPSLGFTATAQNLIRLSRSLHFSQGVVADLPLSGLHRDVSWSTWSISLQLGLRIGFFPADPEPVPPPAEELPPPPPPAVVVEAPPPPPPPPSAEVSSVSLRVDSAIVEDRKEMRVSTPLVPAIFFEKDSSGLPVRYLVNIAPTATDPVIRHTLILGDIAQRLRRFPQARVVLSGATSGKDEKGGKQLAAERANTVAEALRQMGVPPEQMKVESAVWPRHRSNGDYEEGASENRRVDVEFEGVPPIEYSFATNTSTLVASLSVRGTLRNARPGQTLSLAVEPLGLDTAITVEGDTEFAVSFLRSIPLDGDKAAPTLRARAAIDGISAETSTVPNPKEAPLRDLDTTWDAFRPVLRFDYNSDKLRQENKDVLTELAQLVPEGSTISVIGSADELGEEKRNSKLAANRAKAVASWLTKALAKKKVEILYEAGEAVFDNATPAGRFLNRSIRLTVTPPKQ